DPVHVGGLVVDRLVERRVEDVDAAVQLVELDEAARAERREGGDGVHRRPGSVGRADEQADQRVGRTAAARFHHYPQPAVGGELHVEVVGGGLAAGDGDLGGPAGAGGRGIGVYREVVGLGPLVGPEDPDLPVHRDDARELGGGGGDGEALGGGQDERRRPVQVVVERVGNEHRAVAGVGHPEAAGRVLGERHRVGAAAWELDRE